jgi:hypothetical protein
MQSNWLLIDRIRALHVWFIDFLFFVHVDSVWFERIQKNLLCFWCKRFEKLFRKQQTLTNAVFVLLNVFLCALKVCFTFIRVFQVCLLQSTLDITRSKGPENFYVISRVLQDPRYIESYFEGFLVVGTEENSRYLKSFTGLALYRKSTVF